MRVAYFDLGFSTEQYGLQPTKYGGGGVAARYLKEDPELEFYIFAPPEAFENMGPTERRDRCIPMSPEACQMLQRGVPLVSIFNVLPLLGISLLRPDIILHGHTCFAPNRSGLEDIPLVHWCGFDGSAGNPGNNYVLFYDTQFTPRFGEHAKYVKIGKPVPDTFVPSVKEDFIFQCSRHDPTMNTISVAKECLARGIKGVFAGPIHNGYPLMDYIDGKTTVYLGEIGEQEKLDWYRRARLFTLNHTWRELPFNQSAIEAQDQGTPIWVNPDCYFFSHYLRNGINGYSTKIYDLAAAFAYAPNIKQENCWLAARQYDVSVMTASFKTAFREIVEEWRLTHA